MSKQENQLVPTTGSGLRYSTGGVFGSVAMLAEAIRSLGQKHNLIVPGGAIGADLPLLHAAGISFVFVDLDKETYPIEGGKIGKELEEEWNKERDTTQQKVKDLKDSWEKLERGVGGSTEALKLSDSALKIIQERAAATAEDLRQFRNFRNIEIDTGVAGKNITTLGGLIGGIYGQMVDFKGELPDVASGLKKTGDAFLELRTKADVKREIQTTEKQLAGMERSGKFTAKAIQEVKDKLKGLKAEAGETGWTRKLQAAMIELTQYTDALFDGLGTLFSQLETNATIAIENEYKKRLAIIERTYTNEEDKQRAIEALEAEYEIKKTEARRKAAAESKAVALMEATVNTAQGITSALAMFPPNLILAAIVGVMGAAQIAAIAAQPIPLAKGAFFRNSTLLPALTGEVYNLAEGAHAEIVAPEPMLRKIVRDELIALGGGAKSLTVSEVKVLVTQTLTASEIRKLGPAIYMAIEEEFRIRGFSLKKLRSN